MSLKIPEQLEFSEGLKMQIKAQCTESVKLIKSQSETDPHEVIHEVRKSLKKIRGMLRLVRDHIDFYKEANAFFRDEGRRISDLRDATSVIETLDDLYDRYSDQLYQKTFDGYRDHLVLRRKKMATENPEVSGVLKSIGDRLQKKYAEIDSWKMTIETFAELAPGIERVYKRGRKGYERALETQSPDDFHDWRKRIKYLRYQLEVLNRIWPNFLETWEDELHELSDRIGHDRDLFMLSELVHREQGAFADRESCELLQSLIAFRRSQMQSDALKLGKRLYRLDKNDFAGLLAASWESFDS